MSADNTEVSQPVKIGDWWFPFDDAKCRRHFTAEGLQIDHLERALTYVKDHSVAVDGGAHVGSWSRYMAPHFKRILAYELAPDTFECLKRNVADLPHVQPIHAALGDVPGFVGVHDPKHTLGRSVAEGNTVKKVRLDDEKLDALGFLKLDLEGYEYFGLKGAEQTIKRFRPVILIEEKGHGTKYGLEADASLKFLKKLGYRKAFRMKPDEVFVPEPKNLLAKLFSRLLRK